jgi:uncharacterized membrane protein YozB (DUF420 family)
VKRPLQPSSRLGWWAFWLGFATGLWGRVFPILPELLGPRLPIRIPLGLTGAAIEVVLTIAALVAGGVAMKRGERSWFNVVAFALALLIGGFWVFFVLAEVLNERTV